MTHYLALAIPSFFQVFCSGFGGLERVLLAVRFQAPVMSKEKAGVKKLLFGLIDNKWWCNAD